MNLTVNSFYELNFVNFVFLSSSVRLASDPEGTNFFLLRFEFVVTLSAQSNASGVDVILLHL
jgi:hypothetical protein